MLRMPPDGPEWIHTQVLDVQSNTMANFDLKELARYETIRVLRYGPSVQMVHTLLKHCANSTVECVLGHTQAIRDLAGVIAVQTATTEEVHKALTTLAPATRRAVAERAREGQLQIRVVEGHIRHGKIYLLSNGPKKSRCVLGGEDNFATSALMGDAREVLTRYRGETAWNRFESVYLKVRNEHSAPVPVETLCEEELDMERGHDPGNAPVLTQQGRPRIIHLARSEDIEDITERRLRVSAIYREVGPLLHDGPVPDTQGRLILDAEGKGEIKDRVARPSAE